MTLVAAAHSGNTDLQLDGCIGEDGGRRDRNHQKAFSAIALRGVAGHFYRLGGRPLNLSGREPRRERPFYASCDADDPRILPVGVKARGWFEGNSYRKGFARCDGIHFRKQAHREWISCGDGACNDQEGERQLHAGCYEALVPKSSWILPGAVATFPDSRRSFGSRSVCGWEAGNLVSAPSSSNGAEGHPRSTIGRKALVIVASCGVV